MTLLLASQSSGRAAMLRAAGLDFETSAASQKLWISGDFDCAIGSPITSA